MNASLPIPRRTLWVQATCGLLIIALLALSLGCYGTFPLTKAVYEFNGDVTENELGQSLLMWGFIIIPVYSCAMLGDGIIFNLIEFWSGESLQLD